MPFQKVHARFGGQYLCKNWELLEGRVYGT
jgi:hypothetical protein